MRKLICILLCCVLLAMPIYAAGGITSAQSHTTVDTYGTCQVSLTVALRLVSSPAPTFPLPKDATGITVNGSNAKTTRSNDTRNVDISKIASGAGNHTLTFHYTLPNTVVADEDGNLTLTVPLTSGFALPIEKLEFSITLPSQPERNPDFTSTYYLETAASIVDWTINDCVISGVVNQRLQDRESLSMIMAVSPEMFPNVSTGRWTLNVIDLIMAIFLILALVYWLITMRCLPPRRIRRAIPTAGLNAGEIPCRLTGQGIDLTMAVLSWAQMGYLLIRTNDNGRVLLQKQMEMGNERSDLENRLFRTLFKNRDKADATGLRYAQLYRKAMTYRSGLSLTYERNSGNPVLFRVLSAGIGAFGGVSMAFAFVNDTVWRIILSILLGLLGSLAAWYMQAAAKGLRNRNKLPMFIGLGCGAVWFILSMIAGEWLTGLLVVLSQFLAGLAAFFGGRKTESGRQTMSEILGLRRFMRSITAEELERIIDTNPHCFYDLAPYALALDVDRTFARRFGNVQLPECPYLTAGSDAQMTAKEWNQLLRDTVDTMDALHRRMPIDRLLGR